MAQAKKRKRFFDVEIPIIGKETQLYAYEPEELEGKTIKYDMTRLLKGKNALLYLKVRKSDGENKFTASPKKMEIVHASLGRMVRRGTDYVEDSFAAKCKDAELKVKLFMITRRKVHNSVKTALRNRAHEEMMKELENKNAETIFDEMMKNQLQKELSLKLKKIYPLSACEIRVLEIVKPLKVE